MAKFSKTRDGSLIIKVTVDRKFNILSEETTKSDEVIDRTPLIEYLAEEYMKAVNEGSI
ncbi:hypothetical protein [Clostridium sp.]|uniref:hypothetical protein n=1 Tax=Clostridium sp. TaxID=1506 RepID=UPI0035A1350F